MSYSMGYLVFLDLVFSSCPDGIQRLLFTVAIQTSIKQICVSKETTAVIQRDRGRCILGNEKNRWGRVVDGTLTGNENRLCCVL